MYTKAFILAALTASACAQMPALLPRQTSVADADDANVGDASPECISRIQSWAGAIPTPAPAVVSAMANDVDGGMAESGVTGLCKFGAGLPSDQASAFTSYNLDMFSYLSAQSSNLVALAKTCSDAMGAPPQVITSQLGELLTVYSSFSAGACKAEATGSASGSATVKIAGPTTLTSDVLSSITSTATPAGSDNDPVASVSDAATSAASDIASATGNAAPRETGMRAMAALAVGLVGAAVAL